MQPNLLVLLLLPFSILSQKAEDAMINRNSPHLENLTNTNNNVLASKKIKQVLSIKQHFSFSDSLYSKPILSSTDTLTKLLDHMGNNLHIIDNDSFPSKFFDQLNRVILLVKNSSSYNIYSYPDTYDIPYKIQYFNYRDTITRFFKYHTIDTNISNISIQHFNGEPFKNLIEEVTFYYNNDGNLIKQNNMIEKYNQLKFRSTKTFSYNEEKQLTKIQRKDYKDNVSIRTLTYDSHGHLITTFSKPYTQFEEFYQTEFIWKDDLLIKKLFTYKYTDEGRIVTDYIYVK